MQGITLALTNGFSSHSIILANRLYRLWSSSNDFDDRRIGNQVVFLLMTIALFAGLRCGSIIPKNMANLQNSQQWMCWESLFHVKQKTIACLSENITLFKEDNIRIWRNIEDELYF